MTHNAVLANPQLDLKDFQDRSTTTCKWAKQAMALISADIRDSLKHSTADLKTWESEQRTIMPFEAVTYGQNAYSRQLFTNSHDSSITKSGSWNRDIIQGYSHVNDGQNNLEGIS